jgi:hypothetical protein
LRLTGEPLPPTITVDSCAPSRFFLGIANTSSRFLVTFLLLLASPHIQL